MIGHAARVIFRKELIDTLRDRRTLATMLLVPMVFYPLSLVFTSEALESEAVERKTQTIHVLAEPVVPLAIRAALEKAPRIALTERARTSADLAGARRALRAEGDAEIFLASTPTAADAMDRGEPVPLTIFFDAAHPHAIANVDHLESVLAAIANDIRTARLAALGAPPTLLEPFRLDRRSTATRTELGNQTVSNLLPALVLLFIAISSFYPAVDLTAGEKERRTLGTLLSAPVSAVELVIGKYLAVLTVGTLAGLLNVAVIGLTLLRVLASAGGTEGRGPQIDISLGVMFGLAGTVVLVAMPIAALMLLFGTLSRSFRDASTLLSPVLLLVMIPALASSFPSSTLTSTVALVPLMNGALLMKALVLRQATLGPAVISAISSLLFTGLLLLFAARTFADERVLFATEGRRADFRSILTSPPAVGASTGLALAGVAFVVTYYAALLAPEGATLSIVVITQLAAYVGPTALLARWLSKRVAPESLLGLSRPSGRALAAGALIGLGGWLAVSMPAAWLTGVFFSGTSRTAAALEAALELDRVSLATAVLVLAVLPAIAEELTFRGAMLSLFRRSYSSGAAVLLQAAVFGVMHGSVHRLLPTGLLGILLGVLAERTGSIWAGVVAHTMTNTVLLALDRAAPPSFTEAIATPTPLALIAVVPVATGLSLVRAHISRGQNAADVLRTSRES